MKHYITVPWIYKSLAVGQRGLYLRYVKGYIKRNCHGLKIKQLKFNDANTPDIAICEEIEED